MKTIFIFLLMCIPFFAASCNNTTSPSANTTVTNDPCDGPDADIECAFSNMPVNISYIMNIAEKDEPGERMIITGKLFHKDGVTPFANVLLYVYHTDKNGKYSKKGNETGFQKWHGYLHGWARTDSLGRYEIHSIRPAQYPTRDQPAHIHATIKEPGKGAYNISDFLFKGDPLLKGNENSYNSTGGSGLVDLKKSADNIWIGERNITLKN